MRLHTILQYWIISTCLLANYWHDTEINTETVNTCVKLCSSFLFQPAHFLLIWKVDIPSGELLHQGLNHSQPEVYQQWHQGFLHDQQWHLHDQALPYARPETPQRPPRDVVIELLHNLMDEVRRSREESKRMYDDIKKLSQVMSKLEDSNRRMQEHLETSFSIESSSYKVINQNSLVKSIYHTM